MIGYTKQKGKWKVQDGNLPEPYHVPRIFKTQINAD